MKHWSQLNFTSLFLDIFPLSHKTPLGAKSWTFVSSSSLRAHPHVASLLLQCQMCMSMCVCVVCVVGTDIKNNTHINIIPFPLHPAHFCSGAELLRQLVSGIFFILSFIFVILGGLRETITTSWKILFAFAWAVINQQALQA